MTTCHAYSYFSNEEDLRQIEDAVKEAITAVITVFCKLNNNRMREYEMKVAERDKENSVLKMQLERAEDELVSLRQLRISREHRSDSDPNADAAYDRPFFLSEEGKGRHRACVKSKRARGDGDAPCERLLKREFADPCERPVARRDTHTEDAATHCPKLSVTEDVDQQDPRNEAHMELERSPRLFTSPEEHLRIKEEPVDFETVFIKWEVSEEHVRREEDALGKDHEAHPGPTACVTLASPCVVGVEEVTFAQSAVSGDISVAQQRRLSNRERQQRYREKIRADPERQRAYREKDRCRRALHFPECSSLSQSLQNGANQSESRLTHKTENSHCKPTKLSVRDHFGEPSPTNTPGNHRAVCKHCNIAVCGSIKATSNFKRHLQKKHPELLGKPETIALTGHLNQSVMDISPAEDSRYQKRKKLICDLPEQSQKLKRQAWREAARRHRARKKSFLQMTQLTCLQTTEMALNSAAPLKTALTLPS